MISAASLRHLSILCIIFVLAAIITTNALHVHVVCHTHDDVGWLKTYQQYFTGANRSQARANVGSILDTVVASLVANPERKFIYAEMAFFTLWWRIQTRGDASDRAIISRQWTTRVRQRRLVYA